MELINFCGLASVQAPQVTAIDSKVLVTKMKLGHGEVLQQGIGMEKSLNLSITTKVWDKVATAAGRKWQDGR